MGSDRDKLSKPSKIFATPPQYLHQILGLVAMALTFILVVANYEKVHASLKALLWAIRGMGNFYGPLALSLGTILFALLFLPCLPFTLGAGFLYGFQMGTVVVALSTTIAALLAFIIARYLARQFIEKRLGKRGSTFRVIDEAINKNGFRIVFLVRSSPLHPFGVCNYLFGLTNISLLDYMNASAIGMLPGTAMEVYCGTAIKNIDSLIKGEVADDSVHRLLFWGGFVITVVSTIYITVFLKKQLSYELQKVKEESWAAGNHVLTVTPSFTTLPEIVPFAVLPTTHALSSSSAMSSSSSCPQNASSSTSLSFRLNIADAI